MKCKDCESGLCTCGHEFGIHTKGCPLYKSKAIYVSALELSNLKHDITRHLKIITELERDYEGLVMEVREADKEIETLKTEHEKKEAREESRHRDEIFRMQEEIDELASILK